MTPRLAVTPLTPPRPHRPLLVVGPSLGTTGESLWSACAALLDGFEVLAWDLPGHGRSDPADGPFTIEELADAVVAAVAPVLAGRGERAFDYAGDSVGGAVGLALLLYHPERIRNVTLACTGARIGSEQAWTERAALVRREGLGPMVKSSPGRWFGPGFAEREPQRAETLLRALRDADPESYVLVCEALARFDVRERLGEITRPVLAVAGEHDQATPVANLQEVVEGIAGSRLAVLTGIAHLAPAEAPEVVAGLISGDARTAEQARQDGMFVRRAVLGGAHVDRSGGDDLTRDFQEFITQYAWGTIWTRPGLDRRSRSMITLTALVAGGHYEELALHLRAARRNGLSVAEIREVLLQTAIYCGVPAANTAFRVAREVLNEPEPR
ncbi:4-carboxymuconolactone decarboxylase [uncultured Jatrophihabitans sp.]|uniref:bifunctional 3-oxoadipate enol-lactonase/4-carboxymuconolactone decarboxylase PcaDC n=1 Tax=uncultured Jatrophihabitans sp. TaxID=1610747 RepID=UPI0035CA5680